MDPASPDARLSHYRLDRLLGSGGMGAVYLAHDLALDRAVAIKFISPDKASDPSARRRLVQEARAAAALDHPNICSVHEVIDDPDGGAYIVMQYVEGETLATALRRGPLDVRLAFSVAADLAAALAAAHKRGIIHRDLKPQNVVLTPERHAKLLDFGIARHTDVAPVSSDATTDTQLTATGAIYGTPAYMSPEQVQARPLDGRSDLFALGALLFECLTGQRAFRGSSPLELGGQILTQHPPAVSSLRPELGEAHDELCRRLLAKDPADRFQSADELLGALRVLSPDTTRTGTSVETGRGPGSRYTLRRPGPATIGALVILAVLVAAFAIWQWRGSVGLRVDPKAAEWYRLGTEAIRNGAPHGARLALNEAIKTAPDYAPAYIRLAEAETELDAADNAQQALLRVTALVTSESRLPFEDRTRVQAVRALMLRDVDGAVRAYGELARRNPDDPGVWLDLGRAQDASARAADARESYERAIQINDQYAAAHLRRATILGFEGRGAEALAAFDEAERLYRAAGTVEGEVETLIRRGAYLSGAGPLPAARAVLERATQLAGQLQSREQLIRARLTLSSVVASEGNWDEAEKMAAAAVDSALRAELETVAADGLIAVANVLVRRDRKAEADAHLLRAIELAEKRRAQRIVARANLQRAAIMEPGEALAAARGPLEYFQANRYRRQELTALAVMARAHESLGNYAEARALAEQALRTATEIKDEVQAGEALENLAGQTNATGALAEALGFRTRGLEIHRRQGDVSTLAYDLPNTADLLIRVGRHAEGIQLLDEFDDGIANRIEAYAPRSRRVRVLRAMSAAIQHKPQEVLRYARDFPPSADGKPDSISQLAAILLQYADAIDGARGRSRPPEANLPKGSAATPTGRELRYWDLAGRLARNDVTSALSGVDETLAAREATGSYEFEWRIAAIGAAAARQMKEVERERVFSERAQRALERLRREWKTDVASYEARPDLASLRRKAGLN